MASKTHQFKNAMHVYAAELICSTGVSVSYRSVLNVSNGGPCNQKLALKISSLRLKLIAQNFAI